MNQFDVLAHYRKDPIAFFTDVLDVEPEFVWDKMEEIAHSIRDHKRTCIKAGNSLSKSYTMGRVILWFLYTYYPATVITTAPTRTQVEEILWREVRAAHAGARIPLGGDVLKSSLDLQKAFGTPEKWFAMGFSTKADTVTQHATAVQGYHNKNILIIADEAAGIEPIIYEAFYRLMTTEGARLALIGNPTTARGDFVDAFKSKRFNKITVSVFDSPNYKQGKEVIPGLSGRDFVEEIREKFGEGSNQWKSMITGEIPDEDVDSLIPYSWIEKAIKRDVSYPFKFVKRFVTWDVSDGGDPHVIKAWENTTEIDSIELHDKKVEEAEPYVWRLLKQIQGNCIIVDSDGIGRVATSLLQQSNIADTHIIDFEGSSRDVGDKQLFWNCRDEAHWAMRERFEKGTISIANIPDMLEELSAIKLDTKGMSRRGYLKIEPKVDLKSRIGRSPNHADCVMMMCGCFDEVPILHKRSTRYKREDFFLQDEYPFTPATV